MEAEQLRSDPRRSEVIVLTQIEDRADYLASRRSGRSLRRPWSIAEAGVTVLGVSLICTAAK
jgi:hypothetical protein